MCRAPDARSAPGWLRCARCSSRYSTPMKLYTYFRSSAAYRVRIALNLKGVTHEAVPVDLRPGAHRQPDYLARNPQGLIPALEDGGAVIAQSLAIIEYLDETHPHPPLLPRAPLDRARVRSLALAG